MDQQQAAKILAVLQALGLYNYDFSGMSKKDITEFNKAYEKYIEPTFEEQYDRISPRYPVGSAMGQALRLMREERLAPESAIGVLLDNDIEVTPEMEKDFEEYYDFLQKNEISQAERVYELDREGRALGLTASPEDRFEVPVDVVAGLFRLQDGKSISGEAKRAADVAQRAYERYLAAKESGETPGNFLEAIQGELVYPGSSGDQSGGIVVNGKRYASPEEYQEQIKKNNLLLAQNKNLSETQPEQPRPSSIDIENKGDFSIPWDRNLTVEMITGNTVSESRKKQIEEQRKSVQAEREKITGKPGFDYRSSIATAYRLLADVEAQKDAAVAAALRNKLESSFGSPYEQQIFGMDAQMARILAAEAAAKAERERKRRGY